MLSGPCITKTKGKHGVGIAISTNQGETNYTVTVSTTGGRYGVSFTGQRETLEVLKEAIDEALKE